MHLIEQSGQPRPTGPTVFGKCWVSCNNGVNAVLQKYGKGGRMSLRQLEVFVCLFVCLLCCCCCCCCCFSFGRLDARLFDCYLFVRISSSSSSSSPSKGISYYSTCVHVCLFT